jgi:hypothetical protein
MIYHQCPGIESVSSDYACDNATCYMSPDKRVVVGLIAEAGFNINLTQGETIGILRYELKNTKQFNEDAISSEDEARCIQVFMIWKINNSKEFRVVLCLIEHDKRYVWDRDRLMKLTRSCSISNIHVPIEIIYLMYDNTVVILKANITYEEYYKLEVTISKAGIKYDT